MTRSQQYDEEFSLFVAAQGSQLYRRAHLLTTSPHSAEDLVQTTLTRAYAAWWRVRRADDPVAYVHGMVVKAFLSERRRRSSSEVPTAEPDHADVHHEDPTERVVLMEALAGLEPLDRAVVVMRHWDDRSVTETAQLLGLSEAAVKNRSLRALRRLRERLGETLSDDHAGRTT